MWCAELCYSAGHGALLSFDFESDQSYLENFIKQLEQQLRVYPVIGKPSLTVITKSGAFFKEEMHFFI